MDWQELSGSWVLTPPHPLGIIHFLGGAFVATAPHITYRWLLEQLSKQGYIIIATSFLNTLDHKAIAVNVQNRLENILSRLEYNQGIEVSYLPIYGLGHSMGCKLHLLIGSLFDVERAGNILISFNNYPLKQAIPFMDNILPSLRLNLKNYWQIDDNLEFEFTPSPEETELIIKENYQISRNLLVKFKNDTIDQTLTLQPLLNDLYPEMVSSLTLAGNHLTPLGQDLDLEFPATSTPIDTIGKWFKENFSRDLYYLHQEISRWLNPCLDVDF
jgi:hypothetical protein